MRSGNPSRSRHRQQGFGYLLVLFTVAALGLLLAGTGQVWHTQAQREKEAELLFIGNQYRQAILAYYAHTPTPDPAARQYPSRLEDLLLDNRFPTPQRYLRKLYRDPMTGTDQWGLEKVAGRITGVFSLSEAVPIQQAFAARDAEFAGAQRYDQWLFGVSTAAAAPAPALASVASAAR
jgi:type II secretory pathway pseudopilin PulG